MYVYFFRTYGFILTVPDLSPNIGVLWWALICLCQSDMFDFWDVRLIFYHLVFWCRYFFAEVFEFFRNFFLIVFHVNILFMILPLAIRLNHRPCFLAFVYIAISSMLKSYPSVSSFMQRWTVLLKSKVSMHNFSISCPNFCFSALHTRQVMAWQ